MDVFFKDKERVAGFCKAAVEQGIVIEAKHSDAPDGVSCFYLECDDMENLPMLEEDKIGNWAIDRVNDGMPKHPIQMPFLNYSRLVREVEDAIYDFE